MLPFVEDMERRAFLYANQHHLQIGARLGDGKDGIVVSAFAAGALPTALKSFRHADLYTRELACYRRLSEIGLFQVRGHNIPQVIDAADDLQIIQMTVVARPYVLDFASAYLDYPPQFSEEVLSERQQHWAEAFEARWPEAQRIIAHFEMLGVYLLDPSPRNIAFDD